MDNLPTPEQKKQLNSWVNQRDSILIDIGKNKTEYEKLIEINKNLAISNTDISNRIQQSIGRLDEILIKEKERTQLISSEILPLEIEKSKLQTEISSLKSEIKILVEKKNDFIKDIEFISKAHENIFSRTSEIERIISETVKINSSNATEVNDILVKASDEFKKIIDIGEKNVSITNKIISEIPKIVVDLHRDILERKKIGRSKIT